MTLPPTLLVMGQFLCLAVIALTGPIIPEGWAGRIFEFLAVLLGLWAIWAVGPQRVQISPTIAENSILVVRGPYRWIRHPMYTAVLWVSLVPVATDPTPLRIGVWVVLLADLLLKLRYEERLLLAHFEGYAEYRRRSKQLIPFLL